LEEGVVANHFLTVKRFRTQIFSSSSFVKGGCKGALQVFHSILNVLSSSRNI